MVYSYSFCFLLVLLYFVVSRSPSQVFIQVARTSWLLCVSLFFLHYSLCVLGVTSAEKLLCLLCKTISKVSYLTIILWISLEKAECFDFIHSLGCVHPTLNISSRSSLSFELADLLSLFICKLSLSPLYYTMPSLFSLHHLI